VRVIPAQFDGHALTSEACLDRSRLPPERRRQDHQAGTPAVAATGMPRKLSIATLGYAQGRGAPHFGGPSRAETRRLALSCAA